MRLSPKPPNECTDEELLEHRRSLQELYFRMVGTLYPPIVLEEIAELNSELWRRNVQIEYSPEHAPGHTCRAGRP